MAAGLRQAVVVSVGRDSAVALACDQLVKQVAVRGKDRCMCEVVGCLWSYMPTISQFELDGPDHLMTNDKFEPWIRECLKPEKKVLNTSLR